METVSTKIADLGERLSAKLQDGVSLRHIGVAKACVY